MTARHDLTALLYAVNEALRKFATGNGTNAVAEELQAAIRTLEAVLGPSTDG